MSKKPRLTSKEQERERNMIALFMLCLHPTTLNAVTNKDYDQLPDGDVDVFKAIAPNAIAAFQSLLHQPKHLGHLAALFQGLHRDFMLTLQEYDRLDGGTVRAFDETYSDPDICPSGGTIGGILQGSPFNDTRS